MSDPSSNVNKQIEKHPSTPAPSIQQIEKHPNTPGLLQEYVGWIVSPVPFKLPWMGFAALVRNTPYAFLGEFFKNATVEAGIPGFGGRLLSNCGLWLSSYSVGWLVFQWTKRNRQELRYYEKEPSSSFVLSEIRRSFGGILILTLYQGFFQPRNQASERLTGFTKLAALLGMAVWADFHFYATHRLMHIVPALYRKVHSLHHKSYDLDPWSGLSMHPVEHIVYFSSLLPLVLMPHVPADLVQVVSDGLIVNPIPGHIGLWPFERHHFQHHREFNYNYGASTLFDVIFGSDFEAYTQRKLAGKKTAGDERRAAEAARQAQMTMK